jgi:GNAT superfamily N-acetyltransferase
VGSAQLGHDTPANQPHRADVNKLMVYPDFRRRGIARALMVEIEKIARSLGRTLLTLDTRTGDSAEPLYASMGYAVSGVIPGYCLDVAKTRLDSTTVMYKAL